MLADGQSEEAVAEFRQLLPPNAEASIWARAGRALSQSGHYDLAVPFLERVTGARIDLANAILHTKGPTAALQAIEGPVEGQAGDFLLMKALILDADGRTEQAQALLTEDLARTAASPRVIEQAVKLLARRGRFQQALDLLKGRDTAELRLAHAVILALMNQNAAAEKLLKDVESRWPEWDAAYLAHGLLLEATGRKREAAAKLRTAIALGSREQASSCSLAQWFFSPGDCDSL